MKDNSPIHSQCKLTSLAIHDALELISGKWTPIILMALLVRKVLCFTDLKNEIEGISSKVLSDSLKRLEQQGILERREVGSQTGKIEYRLKDYGKSWEPLLEQLSMFGIKHRNLITGRDITDLTTREVKFFGFKKYKYLTYFCL